MRKIFYILLIIFTLTLSSCSLGGLFNKNKEDKVVNLIVEYKIYEVDKVSEKPLSGNQIEVGKNYDIVFNVKSFKPIQDNLKRKDMPVLKIKVNLNQYDDEDVNAKNLIGRPMSDGGFEFETKYDDFWEAKTIIGKDHAPNLSDNKFRIRADRVLNAFDENSITLSFEMEGYDIKLNSADLFKIDLDVNKGEYIFNQMNNYEENNYFIAKVKFPETPIPKIKITYYEDSNKRKIMYEEVFERSANSNNDYVEFNHIEMITKSYYNSDHPNDSQMREIEEKILNGEFDNYFIKIKAFGSNNYIEKEFEFYFIDYQTLINESKSELNSKLVNYVKLNDELNQIYNSIINKSVELVDKYNFRDIDYLLNQAIKEINEYRHNKMILEGVENAKKTLTFKLTTYIKSIDEIKDVYVTIINKYVSKINQDTYLNYDDIYKSSISEINEAYEDEMLILNIEKAKNEFKEDVIKYINNGNLNYNDFKSSIDFAVKEINKDNYLDYTFLFEEIINKIDIIYEKEQTLKIINYTYEQLLYENKYSKDNYLELRKTKNQSLYNIDYINDVDSLISYRKDVLNELNNIKGIKVEHSELNNTEIEGKYKIFKDKSLSEEVSINKPLKENQVYYYEVIFNLTNLKEKLKSTLFSKETVNVGVEIMFNNIIGKIISANFPLNKDEELEFTKSSSNYSGNFNLRKNISREELRIVFEVSTFNYYEMDIAEAIEINFKDNSSSEKYYLYFNNSKRYLVFVDYPIFEEKM